MPVTIRQLLAEVDALRARVPEAALDTPVKVYVSNGRLLEECMEGDWGCTPALSTFRISFHDPRDHATLYVS